MNRTLPAPAERAESDHLHHPPAGTREGRAGAVGPGRRHNTIFHNVAVRVGEQPLREAAAGTGGLPRYDVGSHQKIFSIRGSESH